MLATALVVALVVSDDVALRGSPQPAGALQARLYRGDWLEVRGHAGRTLSVYDHRHQRAGYVDPALVREIPLTPESAPSLRAVIEFLAGRAGDESTTIGAAALYLRAAPPNDVDARVFDALGRSADGLALRASQPDLGKAAILAHLEVARSYGINFSSVERDGVIRICADTVNFERALVMKPSPDVVARAALAISNPACTASSGSVVERKKWLERVLEPLERPELDATNEPWSASVRLRRLEVLNELAFLAAQAGDPERRAQLADRAQRTLLGILRDGLTSEEIRNRTKLAMATAASAYETAPPGDAFRLVKGNTETCIDVRRGTSEAFDRVKCTSGTVGTRMLFAAPNDAAIALQVQLLAGWTELWVIHRVKGAPKLDVLLPGVEIPEWGYAHVIGWSPDGAHLVTVREAWVKGALQRAFEMRNVATFAIEEHARSEAGLRSGRRWVSAIWKAEGLASR